MVPESTRRAGPLEGNGIVTTFAFGFKTNAAADLRVVKLALGVETTLVLDSHYSVALNADQEASPGGDITYPISGSPLAADEFLTIISDLAIEQQTDLPNLGAFYPAVIESALDRAIMLIGQQQEVLDRSITLQASVSGVAVELPTPSANLAIGWNATGDALANIASPGSLTSTATGLALLNAASAAAARTILGSTTVGDAVFIAANAAAGRTALAAAGSGLATASGLTQSTSRLLGRTTAGTGAVEEISVSGLAFAAGVLSLALRSYLAGCGLANGTDATNDINFSAGQCTDSTNAVLITCAAMAGKQLDVGWAPGAAAGMRNSGAAITNTTYHLYAVAKADGTQDYYAHTSTTVATVITALQAESGGSAYLYARRIGSIVRLGATILAFTQDGDTFSLTASVADLALAANVTAAVTKALTVPVGVRLEAFGTASLAASGGGASWFLVSDLSVTDEAPSINNATCGAVASGQNTGPYWVLTDTSARIRYRGSTTNADTISMRTRGWVDRRGRD